MRSRRGSTLSEPDARAAATASRWCGLVDSSGLAVNGFGSARRALASALTRNDRQPAVWVVDPATTTVALRNVEVLSHDPARVIVAQGLSPGDIVVTAGVQALRPGQKVRLLGAAS